ncbi:MAG: hypothetical protein JJU45_02640 [Acidimicrobiia bacterium]|nr:hypothetical protein [Acidimicrobiia bacterium]
MRRLWLVVVASLLVAVVPAAAADQQAWTDPRTGAPVLDELEDLFLTTRPSLGPTTVVSLAGTDTAQRMTLRTLQGVVNKTSARMYLIDPGDQGAQPILDAYVARGDVTVVETINAQGALEKFAHEANGYVIYEPAQEWTVHGAAAIASLEGGVVTSAAQVPALEALGLTEIDDVRGRWANNVAAQLDVAATYRDQLPSDAVAVISHGDTMWDFAHQQGVLTMFSRPTDPTWASLSPILTDTPAGSPIYGYIARNDVEEALGVATLSANGLLLVPTDTTRNLSFHVAVGADRPRATVAPPQLDDVDPCVAETVNVVVALTDGDNLNVPLNHFFRPDNWPTARRGDLPIGWSITPSLATLAPGMWDVYVEQATAADELVAIIGIAYAAPALLPDARSFYRQSFATMETLGLSTFWSLGGALDTPTSVYWSTVDEEARPGVPGGILVSYGNGVGEAYYSPAGIPAFTSRSIYDDQPADLEAHVRDVMAMAPEERPLVLFLSAANWRNSARDVIARLAPLADEGVRFLTPAQAAACMPDAPPAPPPAELYRPCLATDPVVQQGLELISAPAANEVRRVPTAVALPATVTATEAVGPGGRIDYQATVAVDMVSFAEEIFETRIHPIIVSGYGSEIADEAWLRVVFDAMGTTFSLPEGTEPIGDPTVASSGEPATATWTSSGLRVSLGRLVGDAQVAPEASTATAPFEVDLAWSVQAATRPDDHVAEVVEDELSFTLDLSIGLSLSGFDLTGGVVADWECESGNRVVAATLVEGTAPPSTSTTTSVPPTTSTSTTLAPTSSTTEPPVTTTTVPPTTSTTTAGPATTAGPTTTGPEGSVGGSVSGPGAAGVLGGSQRPRPNAFGAPPARPGFGAPRAGTPRPAVPVRANPRFAG